MFCSRNKSGNSSEGKGVKMMEETKPIDRPFHVRLSGVDGPRGFTAGYDTSEEAAKSVDEKNERAKMYGLKASYVVVPKPAA